MITKCSNIKISFENFVLVKNIICFPNTFKTRACVVSLSNEIFLGKLKLKDKKNCLLDINVLIDYLKTFLNLGICLLFLLLVWFVFVTTVFKTSF